MRVLAVQIDEPASVLGQFAHGCEATVDVTAQPAVGRYDTREHDLVVAVVEPALDPRFGRAVAHQLRIGAAARQQVERVDDQGLARAGLAGDDGQPRAQRHL